MKKIFCLLFAAGLLASCKDSKTETDYIITPFIQLEQELGREDAVNVKAYAYYGDTTYWKIMSWEDAVDGVITNKSDEDRTRTPDFAAELNENGQLVLGPITQMDFMVLVCHTEPDDADGVRMYAWRNAKTIEDLPQITVNLTFKPWRTANYVREARWLFVYEHPEPVEPIE